MNWGTKQRQGQTVFEDTLINDYPRIIANLQLIMARKVGSYKKELITKSREAMLSAVEIYNNPNIRFKSETFIILAIISWTYLLHAYYKEHGIDFHYYKNTSNGRKRYEKTKYGAKKSWELDRCLNEATCPLSPSEKENLRFLIGIRHEIEHQMTTRIDDALSAKFQACCLNYNKVIKNLFGEKMGIDGHLSFSLQFSSISEPQKEMLSEVEGLPDNIKSYIVEFEENLDEDIFNNPSYSYRILFVPKTVNRKGQADRVVEFVKGDSEAAEGLNKQLVVIKEREKTKHLPKEIVEMMKAEGYTKMNMHHFTEIWKGKYEKKPNSPYGCLVAGKNWYWYDSFIPIVREYCEKNNLR